VEAGVVVGRLEVTLPDGRSQSVPIETAEAVDRKGLFGRAGASLARLIRGG
jgi:D-alanyl-D-alanine carboxypeptidase (penicillin-binding protein 5/6)